MTHSGEVCTVTVMQTVTSELTGPQQRWAEALESGEFAQAAGSLRNSSGYCCLGVACEVYIRDGGTLRTRIRYKRAASGRTIVTYNGRSDGPPAVVREYFLLTDAYGSYGGARSLMNDNDVLHRSFPEIAETLRSRPEGLFESEL